jgi:hypothetical protein
MMRPYPDIVPGHGRQPSAQQLADGPQIPTEVEEHAKSSSRSQSLWVSHGGIAGPRGTPDPVWR